jgi:hypothetical protein
MQWRPFLPKGGGLIQLAISGHPPIPTGSSCPFLVQHILLYFFVIVDSTLLGLSKSLHIFLMDIGGLSPNPTSLFYMFSCHHILMYFQGRFGGLNTVFLTCHSQTADRVRVCWRNVYLSERPFQRAITHLKLRSYANVMTLRS